MAFWNRPVDLGRRWQLAWDGRLWDGRARDGDGGDGGREPEAGNSGHGVIRAYGRQGDNSDWESISDRSHAALGGFFE